MNPHLFAFAGLLVSLSVRSTLEAQEPAKQDSGRVAGDSGKSYALPPLVVTASIEPLRQDRIGFASSVLRDKELGIQPAPFAARMLQRIPDVFIDEGAGPGGPTVLRIRGGEEPYTKVLWDGVALNISGGFLDLQGLTLSNVERVEVARGPHSALYGSSAMSGVVQFITRRGQVGAPSFDARWEGGTASHDGESGRGELSVRGGVPGLLYSAGGGLTYDRGIYALAHNAWTKDGSLRLDATPSSRISLTAIARYGDLSTHLPVRDPGATRVPLDPNQRDSRQRLTTSLTGTFNLSPTWTHRLSAGLLRDNFYYGDKADGVTQPPDFFIADFSLRDKGTTRRATVEYVGTNRFGRSESGGGAFSYGASVEGETSGDKLTSPDFGDSQLELKRTSQSVFTELQAGLGSRISLLGGTRLEKFQGLPLQLTPGASVVISVAPRLLLRGAVGRSYKVPNLFQQYLDNPFTAPNPNLAPETAFSWETGLTLTAPRTPIRASATYFRQEYRNLIRTVPADDDQRGINKNLGRSRAYGIELELAYQPSERFEIGANGTWLRTTVLDNTGLPADQYPLGQELPFRPHLLGNAYIQASAGHLSIEARGTLVGNQTALTERFSGRRATIDGYALAGLTLSYALSHALSLYLAGDNLFDKFYETGFDRRGLPLRVTAGARLAS